MRRGSSGKDALFRRAGLVLAVAVAAVGGAQLAIAVADDPPPETIGKSGPPAQSSSSTADFEFTSNESGAVFECRLDGGAYKRCSSRTRYTGIPDGNHILEVRALDQAGQPDPTPLSYAWSISGGGGTGAVGPADSPAPPPPTSTTPTNTTPTSTSTTPTTTTPTTTTPLPPDTAPPSVAISRPGNGVTVKSRKIIKKKVRRGGKTRTVKRSKRLQITLSGTVADQSGVKSVELALRLVRAIPCAWFDGSRSFVPRSCNEPLFFKAKLRDTNWSFVLPTTLRLSRGTYELIVRATDGKGQTNTAFDESSHSRVQFKLS